MRKVVGILAALGVIGAGTAHVIFNNNGSETVKVTSHGVTRTVRLGGSGGQSYSCPNGSEVEKKLTPIDETSGRINLASIL
jgi:hypothetical protein